MFYRIKLGVFVRRKVHALSGLAWPSMVEALAQLGLGFADALFIAHIGLGAVGTIGVATSIPSPVDVHGLVAFVTTSLVAQCMGGKRLFTLLVKI